ncbi:MAG TPA: FAD-dependent oxidoreductase [Fimbriimonadaceae bacterium]|nr:FAD-dependent oxidoreductase [Fimbriimonadaceae bacterium]
MKYRARAMDSKWLRSLVSCRGACPVETNAQGYIEAIARNDFDAAYEIARFPNPFVNICARICGHPCEFACRRGKHDDPISIRGLKRAAADHSSAGFKSGGDFDGLNKTKKKVAVIGAGPAGLTAAHDLTLLGFQATLFEASDRPGGMLVHGIPEYRLPRDIMNKEIESLLSVGVDLRTNCRIGDDISLEDLLSGGYDAVFLGVGAQKGRGLPIAGIESDGVINGIDFLLNQNLGYKVEIGQRVVVIGGGNVAMDVARTAIRGPLELTAEDTAKATTGVALGPAVDVARIAKRSGATEVHLMCLESPEEMPAYEEEIVEALNEGIVLHNSVGPVEVEARDGKCAGLVTRRCLSVFDDRGRFSPKFEEGSESTFDCDTILLAIGQETDLSFLSDESRATLTSRGLLKTDPDTMATSIPGVFAGGDAAFGARTAIEAVADGRKAAFEIHRYLTGAEAPDPRHREPQVIRLQTHHMAKDYDYIPRQEIKTLPMDRRVGITEVEVGFSRMEAVREAQRCLKCNLSPMVDWDKCVLCGGCVDVCPYGCLRIVPVDNVDVDDKLKDLAQKRHSMTLEDMASDRSYDGPGWYAMLKDEELCTRCGLCVERCPVDAMWMGRYQEGM